MKNDARWSGGHYYFLRYHRMGVLVASVDKGMPAQKRMAKNMPTQELDHRLSLISDVKLFDRSTMMP